MIKVVSCLVIILRFLYSKFAVLWKNGKLNPPYFVGNDNSILLLSEQIWPPVIAGMNFCWILCFNGGSDSLMSKIVKIKYVSLLWEPIISAAYADCGSISAI